MTSTKHHDISKLSGRALAALLRAGQVDPTEIAKFHLSRVDAHNASLNAVRWIDRAQFLADAVTLREKIARGEPLGRVSGMVLTVKDSIHVKGMPRSDGSIQGLLRQGGDLPSQLSAATVQRLQIEDGLVLGKANMAEMGRSYFTENPRFGRTVNPFNPERSPGGSGGGDAAAIAVGMAKGGVGADSGGSIRVPANFCGVFGLYPTPGVIPTLGMSGLNHTTRALLRNHGPLAAHLEDLELLFELMCSYVPSDPTSVPFPLQVRAPGTKKFLWYSGMPGIEAHHEIRSSLLEVVRSLQLLGFHGEERVPSCVSGALEPFVIIAGQAALVIDDARATAEGVPNDPTKEGPLMQRLRDRIAQFLPPLTSEKLLMSWYELNRLRYEAASLFTEYDFILSPVTATLPPPHNAPSYDIDGQTVPSEQVFRFASAVNVLGVPAIAFPTVKSREGLPIGLQLIGPRFSDRMLCQVVRELGFVRALTP
jgi:amidase